MLQHLSHASGARLGKQSAAPGLRTTGQKPSLPDRVELGDRGDSPPPEDDDGFSWKKAVLLGAGAAGLIGGVAGVATVTPVAVRSFDSNFELTQEGWETLISPTPWEGEQVVVGGRVNAESPVTIAETRARLQQLDFLELDPYVATIASAVDAGLQRDVPSDGESKIKIEVPGLYEDEVELKLGTHNGPGAPMMVILPGIFGDGDGGNTNTFKRMALERGMNYLVVPNSLSTEALKDDPLHHPGNPRLDAVATYDILARLKDQHPEFFQQVSVAGYSYGALHGANLMRYEEELMEAAPGGERILSGGLVALSPPEDLSHSMRQLDGLREFYRSGSGSIIWQGLKYRRHVKEHGYENFLQSELAQRGHGSNVTEIKMADKFGSRNGMEKMVDRVDRDFDHHQLPRHTREYRRAPDWRRDEMRREHMRILDQMTYQQFSDNWMSKDSWLLEQGLTPEKMSEEYSYSNALEVIDETPVMTLLSADDYILNADNVEKFRELEAQNQELEVMRVFEHGGHVGLTFNPEVRDAMGDFAHTPPRKAD